MAEPKNPLTPANPLRRKRPRLGIIRAAFRAAGRIAPGTTARVAEALFVRTERPTPRAEEEHFLASAERFAVRAAGQTIVGYRWGERGPLIVFAHGWWSHAGRFAPLAEAVLAAGGQAVAFDAAGHGRSSGWRSSMPEIAASLRAVVTHVGPVRAIVGHSLGGAATVFALARGLRAECAVVVAAPSDMPSWAHRFRDLVGLSPGVYSRMERNMERRLRLTWQELSIPVAAAQLELPGLVIHDVDDPDVPWTEGEAIARDWRNAVLVTTQGLGHRAILRDPGVIERIVAFVMTPATVSGSGGPRT